jgi:hypothetical protein
VFTPGARRCSDSHFGTVHGPHLCDEHEASRDLRRLVEYLCAVMHSAYEDEAARVGWATNPRSKTSWDRVPDENKQAMRAGVRAMLAVLGQS